MFQLVNACSSARFCCASALGTKHFLRATAGLVQRGISEVGYDARGIYSIFSHLDAADSVPMRASASRRVFRNGSREVSSLCPGDELFELFLRFVGHLLSPDDGTTRRIPTLSPNQLSVVLWVRCGDAIALLGGDLEKPGWTNSRGPHETDGAGSGGRKFVEGRTVRFSVSPARAGGMTPLAGRRLGA